MRIPLQAWLIPSSLNEARLPGLSGKFPCGPPLVNALMDEGGIIDCAVYKYPFAIFGLFGTISMSSRAARIVAAESRRHASVRCL